MKKMILFLFASCLFLPIVANAQSKTVVAMNEEGNIALLAVEDKKQGMYKDFELQYHYKSYHFSDWLNVANSNYHPHVYFEDINDDKEEEIVVVLIEGTGTALHIQKVHVFHQNNQKLIEIPVRDYEEIIDKHVKTSLKHQQASVKIKDITTIVDVSKKVPEKYLFKDVVFANNMKYTVKHGYLYLSVAGFVSMSGSIGGVVIRYQYEDDMYKEKEIHFEPFDY